MLNFESYNPVKIYFGKGQVENLSSELKSYNNILFAYGGGSIKKNGVYDQVVQNLSGKKFVEFSGIEANPEYDTLMKAVKICREQKIDFILAVGGGSVIDGCKFIAHATYYPEGKDPWEILTKRPNDKALPLGCVLTLSATGTEMNAFSVVSRRSLNMKRDFASALSYPKFSILDPMHTLSLPKKQVVNGIIDPFVHVTEQYLTFDVNSPLQNRQSEAILKTLVEEGPKVLENLNDYESRANIMWAATQALNGTVGLGVPQDWATHRIGHILTARYGLDHAVTLAIVLPALLRTLFEQKRDRLAHYGRAVWGLSISNTNECAQKAIVETEQFFRKLGALTKLSEHNIDKNEIVKIADHCKADYGDAKLGEKQNIDHATIINILKEAY